MPVTADFGKLLDKEYEDLPLNRVLDAPVSALAGISAADAEFLLNAFRVRTIRDLGRNRYFRGAATLVDLESVTS